MADEKTVVLPAIKETTADYEDVEKKIKKLFRDEIYNPILRELNLGPKTLQNSAAFSLAEAIKYGRLQYSGGRFTGKFSAATSKELKELGAKWDRKTSSFVIPERDLPATIRMAISASNVRFEEKLQKIDKKLSQILPEEFADKLKVSDNFDSSLWKVDRDFHKSLKNITVAPTLTADQRKRIADEWQNNMKLWITDFTKKEIGELRKNMQETVFKGNRYESAVKTIQASYGVTENKAKFLARQETSLLMTKFKQTRYEAAGVMEYKWGAVAGSVNHPTRPWHKALAENSNQGKTTSDGKCVNGIFRWSDPPNTAGPGEAPRYNNPGQDYNCRCFAKPVVRFKGAKN